MYAMASTDAEGFPEQGLLHVPELAWPEHACLGGGLPPAAEAELRLAGLHYTRSEIAERHLRNALAAAPGHFAVEIGLYRYYFYKGRLHEALNVAARCPRPADANPCAPACTTGMRGASIAFSA